MLCVSKLERGPAEQGRSTGRIRVETNRVTGGCRPRVHRRVLDTTTRGGRSLPARAQVMRERFLKPNKITTLTVIWARQLVSPQPKLGPVP